MKKIISALLVLITVCMLVSCDSVKSQDTVNLKNDEPLRVQSISYYMDGEYTDRLISGFQFDVIRETATASDYEKATDKFSTSGSHSLSGAFGINGASNSSYSFLKGKTPDELREYVGKTIYFHDPDSYVEKYYKVTITELYVNYVNVTFSDDECLMVSYFDYDIKETVTMRIKTDRYTVIFFTENE